MLQLKVVPSKVGDWEIVGSGTSTGQCTLPFLHDAELSVYLVRDDKTKEYCANEKLKTCVSGTLHHAVHILDCV